MQATVIKEDLAVEYYNSKKSTLQYSKKHKEETKVALLINNTGSRVHQKCQFSVFQNTIYPLSGLCHAYLVGSDSSICTHVWGSEGPSL